MQDPGKFSVVLSLSTGGSDVIFFLFFFFSFDFLKLFIWSWYM